MHSLSPELSVALNDPWSGPWRVEYALDALAAKGLLANVGGEAVRLKAMPGPAPRKWLGQRFTALWDTFMAGRQVEPVVATSWLMETTRLLDDLPHDILSFATDESVKRASRGFMPSVGEIRAIADPLAEARKQHLERAEELAAALADDSMRAERETRWAAAARHRAFRPELFKAEGVR